MQAERVRGIVFAAVLAVVAACAATPAVIGPPAPREILQGRASFVLQPLVDVSQDEIAAALRPMIARAPVCMRFPGLWLGEPVRGSDFVVRLDLMARDWGQDVAAAARARLDAFVEMGFLTAAPSDGAIAYTFTPLGRSLMRGTFESGRPPAFCAPSERQLIAIASTERGEFPCGSLRVRFSHNAEQWPSWATTEAARRYLTENGLAPGEAAEGSVSLSRLWYSRDARPRSVANGSIASLCYDARRDTYRGDDFALFSVLRADAPASIEDAPVEETPGVIESAPLAPPPDLPPPEATQTEGPTP